MPWAIAAGAAASAIAQEQLRQYNMRLQGLAPFRTGDKPADKSLEQLAREHRARMDAMHSETMRHARIVTALLGAFVLVAGYMIAKAAGL